jgi:glycopeptide antibiotics resistance protein
MSRQGKAIAGIILEILFYAVAALYAFMLLDLFLRFSYIFDADRIISRSYNLIPFRTIGDYLSGNIQVSRSQAVTNVLGNIAVFIPYGVYLHTLQKRRSFTKSVTLIVLSAVAIEATQFAFGLGACDIDDVLLNSLGGAMGVLGYVLARKALKEEARTRTAISALSVIAGAPVIYLYFTTVFNHLRL